MISKPEDENEISLHEYIIMVNDAIIECQKDMIKMASSLEFCIQTLNEMKEAEWTTLENVDGEE